jgi:hypothetical protein
VSEPALRDWWNNGVAEIPVWTFKSLVKYNLAHRLGVLNASMWRKEMYVMLKRTPSVASGRVGGRMDRHFANINSTLVFCWSLHYRNQLSHKKMRWTMTISVLRRNCISVSIVV